MAHAALVLPDSRSPRWREVVFEDEMRARRSTYTRPKRLQLFAGTWNVNGRFPDQSINLRQWLFPAHMPAAGFDVYMLGFQEIQPLTGVDAVRTDNTRGMAWRSFVQSFLERKRFVLVSERQLVGILIIVFIKEPHLPFLSEKAVSYAGTGFLNALGNKGAVAVRFRLYDRLISCVSCHLAAHDYNVDRRNQDFRDVVRKAMFPSFTSLQDSLTVGSGSYDRSPAESPFPVSASTSADFDAPLPTKTGSGLSQGAAWIGSVAAAAAVALADVQAGASSTVLADPNSINVLDHDAVFWLGDMNYRIAESAERVLLWIEKEDWSSLCTADQLCQQMQICDVFLGFREGTICFAPTYKLERFKNVYSRDESGELKRTPAYTDRILWRRGFPDADPETRPEIELLHYDSAPSVFSSDHRPVLATFAMKFLVDDPEEKHRVADIVQAELDIRELELRPSIRISMRTLALGSVRFEQRASAKLVVTNDGRTPVSFSVPREIFPAWLSLSDPRQQMISSLYSGESVGIMFQALVTSQSGCSAALGCGEMALESKLYIQVDGHSGVREEFEIKGRYVQTCLGSTLDVLAMCSEPMQYMRPGDIARKDREHEESEYRAGQSSVPLPIPKEIWWLVDLLWRKRSDGVNCARSSRWIESDSRLFLSSGNLALTEVVQDCVDSGSRMPDDVNALAIGSCLTRLLRSLEEPVIPCWAYHSAVEAGKARNPTAVTALLSRLSPLHSNVFTYIIRLLREMPSVKNGTAVQEVSEVFGEILLAPDKTRPGRDLRDRALFVRMAIKGEKDLPNAVIVIDIARSSLHLGTKGRNYPHQSHDGRHEVSGASIVKGHDESNYYRRDEHSVVPLGQEHVSSRR